MILSIGQGKRGDCLEGFVSGTLKEWEWLWLSYCSLSFLGGCFFIYSTCYWETI